MARNPVTPVIPVNPVRTARKVDHRSSYFWHLAQWRISSEFHAAERRLKAPRANPDAAIDFAQVLADSKQAS